MVFETERERGCVKGNSFERHRETRRDTERTIDIECVCVCERERVCVCMCEAWLDEQHFLCPSRGR